MRNVSERGCREETQSYIQFFFFWKSCRLCYNAEKYSRGRQTPHNSVMLRRENAIYLLDNKDKDSDAHL